MTTAIAQPQRRTVLADLLDGHDVEELFNVGWLTLLNWRKNKAMPHVLVPGRGKPTIRYYLGEVLEWAKQRKMEVDPARLAVLKETIRVRLKKAKA